MNWKEEIIDFLQIAKCWFSQKTSISFFGIFNFFSNNSENFDSSVFELISILIFTKMLINWMYLWIFIVRIWEYADETPHLSSTITFSLYVTIRSSFLSLPHASWCAFSFCITYFLMVQYLTCPYLYHVPYLCSYSTFTMGIQSP